MIVSIASGLITSQICAVAQRIYKQVTLVKVNHKQCIRLAERIQIIERSVVGLDNIENNEQYEKGLKDLLLGLNNCLEFIEQSSQTGSFKALFKSVNYNERFENLSLALEQSMQQLNLGFSAQHLLNREKDKLAQQADIHFIKDNYLEIIKEVQKGNDKTGKLDLELKENQEILMNQFESMKAKIMAFLPPALIAPYFELIFDKRLCDGSLGRISLGRWKEQVTVIKSIEDSFNEADKAQFVREVQEISQCQNEHITQLYGASVEPQGRACLLMEHMEQGSLYEVLKKPLSAQLQKQLALEIAQGLQYLHNRKIFYHNFKSTNVLVNAHNHAKLSGFGLSKTRSISIKTEKPKSEVIRWFAPECFGKGDVYTAQSDIYSYGVILWELMTGKRPYAELNEHEISDCTLSGKRELLGDISEPYATLIKQCWATDPKERPTINQIIQILETPSLTPEEHYKQGRQLEKVQDYTHALESYHKAFEYGHVKAETHIGLFFLFGKAGICDKTKAHACFLDAANKGDTFAMANLATMLTLGDGVPKNTQEALSWLKKARELGYKNADADILKLETYARP